MQPKKQYDNSPKNNVFTGLDNDKMRQIESRAIPHPTILLASTYLTPSREVVDVAEALVAYDSHRGVVTKFIAAFVPGCRENGHDGRKFLISRKNEKGYQKPIVIEKRENQPVSEGDKPFHWNNRILRVYLDPDKLPMTAASEFRILRAYRHDVRTRYRFEILAFDMPRTGQVDKRTMRLEKAIPRIPPLELVNLFGGFVWFQKEICQELSMFSGEDVSLVLGLEAQVREDLRNGKISPEQAEAMMADHSQEEPRGRQESMAETLGTQHMVLPEDGEGRPFYAPPNPFDAALANHANGVINEGQADEDEPTNVLAVAGQEDEIGEFPEE